jgi:hypothetical protein
MADDRIDVKVGASTGELKTGMAQAESTVKQGVAGMTTPFDRMGQTVSAGMKQMTANVTSSFSNIFAVVSRLHPVLLAITTVLAGGSLFKSSVDETIKWNSQARSLSSSLGITTEEASALNEAIQDLGVATLNSNLNVDTLKRALSMMQRELANNEQAFNDLGIQTRETNGEYKNSLDIFLAAMGYLKNLEGETLQNVEGTKLFKRSWAEVRPLMGLTEESIAKTSEEMRKQGRLVTSEGIQKSVEYKKALDNLDDAHHALSLTIGNAVTPALTKMATGLNWVLERLGEVITASTSAESAIADFWAAAGRGGGHDSSTNALIDYLGAGYTVEPGKPKRKSGGDPKDPPNTGTGAGGGASLVQKWVQELEQIKAAEEKFQSQSLKMEKAFWAKKLATGEAATQEELEALKSQERESEAVRLKAEADYWKGKLILAGAGTKDYQEVQHKIVTLEQQQNKLRLQSEIDLIKSKIKAGQDAIKDKMALIDHENQLDRLNIDMKRENTAHLAKMGAMSRVQELKQYKLFKQQEHEIDLKAAQDKAKLDQGDSKAYQKHLKDIELLKKKQALEIKKIDFEITQAMKAQWGQVWNAVSQAFQMSVQGIITGTTTLADAIKNIWQSILTSLVGMFLEIALEYIASTIMMMIFGKAADKEKAASAIGAQSGIAGAAGYASVMVALPFPANVAVAPMIGSMAAAQAASFGVLASAAGGWEVPEDTLAYVHKKEVVLPTEWTERFKAMTTKAPAVPSGPSHLVAKFPITVVTPDGRTILKENKTMFFELTNQGITKGEIRIPAPARR